MKCPHCLTAFHDTVTKHDLGEDSTSDWTLHTRHCPECKKYIFSLHQRHDRYQLNHRQNLCHSAREFLCYPTGYNRAPVSKEVPAEFASDYREACAVLDQSPMASAALSRRCLQHLLREKVGVTKGDLAREIQQVLDAGKFPTMLLESLDAIRNIGNFAAHPIKSTSSGEILAVEPGEAEWNLDVLESLFDYLFVQPEVLKKKRAALDTKLQAAGKPPLK